MAKSFSLPAPYPRQRWKLKIRDRERGEPPHVTIMFKTTSWRFGLRERAFLDREPDPGQVPRGILDFIEENFPALVATWDELYPHNPVQSEDA